MPSRSSVTDRPNPRSLRFVPAHAPQVPGIGYSNREFDHLLWVFKFMSVYARNENKMCTPLGGIDPNTMQK